jgi:uncharacterized protein
MGKEALIIFAKNPQPGKVKTRLAKFIGLKAALKCYIELLTQTYKNTKHIKPVKFLFLSDFIDNEMFDSSYIKVLQKGKNLGEKMDSAFDHVFELGYEKICIIGTDCPELDENIIQSAFNGLDENDIVLGPANDGGYYLLGMKDRNKFLFDDSIMWSTNKVLSHTIDIISQNSKNHFTLPELSDVDTIKDYINHTGFEVKHTSKESLSFVLKKHDSTTLHYDFRIELFGVLISFYTKEAPRLAPGQPVKMNIYDLHKTGTMYDEKNRPPQIKGPGPSIVLDKGYYYPVLSNKAITAKKAAENIIYEGIFEGYLELDFKGTSLQGRFTLKRNGNSDEWTFTKLKDEFVSDKDLSQIERSVLTGRTLDDIRNGARKRDVNQVGLEFK